MKEKKNIDRIYQEKFKDFEENPDERMWSNIASRLDEKERKKPIIIPLWFKIGGVAAVMAIILASLIFTNNQHPNSVEPAVVFENPENSTETEHSEEVNKESDNNNFSTSKKEIPQENSSMAGTQNSSSDNRSSGTSEKNQSQETLNRNLNPRKTQQKNLKNKNNTAIAMESNDSSGTENEKGEVVIMQEVSIADTSGVIAENENIKLDTLKSESILNEQEALAELEKEKDTEEAVAETNSKKMRLSTFAAPVFYKNIGNGNELSNQLSENSSSSEVTFSYGIKVAYKISKKLSIRTGISKVDISSNIQGISYSPAMASSFENLSPLEDNIEIRNNNPSPSGNSTGPLPSFNGDENTALTTSVATPGEIRQQFGYIEVPLELEYALIDRKFGLNIIGGGSSLFLDNNRVDLIAAEGKTDLGEATNINSTSFSTNIGVGMDYDLTDKFSISVEPIFKYQLNTFNNVDNVQPINFGIYSGLNFRF